MTTKLKETVATEEWEQALEVVRKQAAELDRLRALLRRWEVTSPRLARLNDLREETTEALK